MTDPNGKNIITKIVLYVIFFHVAVNSSLPLNLYLYRQTAHSSEDHPCSGHQHTPQSLGLCEKDRISWTRRYFK